MWSNIGKVEENKANMEFLPGVGGFNPMSSASSVAATTVVGGGAATAAAAPGTTSSKNNALYLYADCHSSIKGLFFGLCFTVIAIIGVAVFFILSAADDCDIKEKGRSVNHYFEITMLSIMIVVNSHFS